MYVVMSYTAAKTWILSFLFLNGVAPIYIIIKIRKQLKGIKERCDTK